jgi:hypothetical protein
VRPRGSGSAPGRRARSGCRASRTGRSVRARTARALSAAGWSARPWRARDLRARGSAPAAPSSDRCRAPTPGSGDCPYAPARRSRTRRTDRTCRPRRETDRALPRAGWDPAPVPAVLHPAAARPAVRPAARSRPAPPSAAAAPRRALAAPAHRARTWRPATARRLVGHEHVVLVRRPIDAGVITHIGTPQGQVTSRRPDQELPLRNLIDKALNGATSRCRLRHLTTAGTGRSALGPPPGQGRWPSPGGGRGITRMTYEGYGPWRRLPLLTPPIETVRRCDFGVSVPTAG